MTLAEQALANLNAALASDGENVEIRRLVGTQLIPINVDCRAFVRGYRADELTSGIIQTDRKVILSPSEIIATGWPGPNSSATPTDRDRRVPIKGDKAVIAGRVCNIEASTGIYIDNQLVRIELQARG